jgi:two-component system, cell cycle sensor histidine kinase and response regulator CckA
MKSDGHKKDLSNNLCKPAADPAQNKSADLNELNPEDANRLIQELQTRQAELQMQNNDLIMLQQELESLRKQAEITSDIFATINTLSIELASLPYSENIYEFLTKRLKDVTGAIAVAFSSYDPNGRMLVSRHLDVKSEILGKIISLLGKPLEDVQSPVSEEAYREITSSVIGRRQTLTETSFGAIPSVVGAAIQKLLGIDYFIGIAYVIEGELFGTSMLAIKASTPEPSVELLELFARIVSVALRRRRMEDAIHYRIAMEELVSSISARFVSVTSDEIDNEINNALQKIGEFDDVDRCYINLFSSDGTKIEQEYNWYAKGIEPFSIKGQQVDIFKWAMGNLKQFRYHEVTCLDDLPPEARTEKEFFRSIGIRSLITMPLVCNNSLIGIFGLTADRNERHWSEEDLRLLKMIGDVIVNSLVRTRSEKLLRESEETVKAILNANDNITFLIDTKGTLIAFNKAFAQRFGKSENELFGTCAYDLLPPEVMEKRKRLIDIAIISGEPIHFEDEMKGRYFNNSIYPIVNSQGNTETVAIYADNITKIKQAESELKKERDKAQIYLDIAGITIVVIDNDQKVSLINKKGCEVLGYSEDEIIGKNWFDSFLPEHNRDEVKAIFDKIMTGDHKSFEYYENSVLNKSGEERTIAWNNSYVTDDTGKIIYIIASGEDITEHKQMVKQLQLASEWLGLAQQAANAGAWDWDMTTGILTWSKEFYELFGLDPSAKASFEAWLAVLHPDDRESAMEKINQTIKEHIHLESEYRIIHPDGDIRWIIAKGDTLYNESGQPMRMSGICVDNTIRKMEEEILIENEAKYKSLFNSMINGFSIHEMIYGESGKPIDYRFLDVNPAFEQITGLRKEFVIGKTALEVLPNLESYWIDTYGEVVLTGKPKHFEQYTQSLSKYFEVTAYSPRKNQFAVIFNDVTDRKQLEEQLRQSQKMEAIGQLAGGVAHDFNNLLQVITGYSEFVLAQLSKVNPMRSNIEEIKNAGEQAASLTRQLLAFSRRQMLQQQIISVNDIVYNMGKMLKRLIGEDIELIVSLSPDIMTVKADQSQIEQVIMNLVINARDAMPDGGELIIKTKNVIIDEAQSLVIPESQPGEYVYISISDNGIGMGKEIIEHIFEPFFSTKKTLGTGLGLSVVYGIVKQHEGWINVESEPNRGSIFKIFLPAINARPEAEIEETPPIIESGNNERILLIEDEPKVLEFISTILEESGYIVLQASNVKEAIEIFEREGGNFDLVFSDVVLPDTSGVQLAEMLHATNPSLRILLSSGYSDQKSQWETIQEKGYHFIQKPYKITDLLKVIKEIMK